MSGLACTGRRSGQMEAPHFFETGPVGNHPVTLNYVPMRMWLISDDGRQLTVLSSRTSSVTEQVILIGLFRLQDQYLTTLLFFVFKVDLFSHHCLSSTQCWKLHISVPARDQYHTAVEQSQWWRQLLIRKWRKAENNRGARWRRNSDLHCVKPHCCNYAHIPPLLSA